MKYLKENMQVLKGIYFKFREPLAKSLSRNYALPA